MSDVLYPQTFDGLENVEKKCLHFNHYTKDAII